MRQHVTPANPGAKIPEPSGAYLPAAGADVEMTSYWIALASRGDVIVTAATDAGSGGSAPIVPAVQATDQIPIVRAGQGTSFAVSDLAAFLGAGGSAGGGSGSGSGSGLSGVTPSASIVNALIFG